MYLKSKVPMALGMDSATHAKLRADIRADLHEEIMAEVCQQLIPMVRALVQEVMDSVKSTVAATHFDEGTHYLDAVQQAEEKKIRESSQLRWLSRVVYFLTVLALPSYLIGGVIGQQCWK
ncbi:hypothetical protein Tcan_04408 [Toxocara canis]|uniref:Uncharacterized protein n=1 Tax=Toxocara canis TaxID=6265 RepID=A0A0B2VZZ0_TOXCA|nr:hypothetical protein Tcan_04408 [Toxocara canis]